MSKLDFGGSNLVKGYRLTPEEGTHIVDTNSIIEEKLRRLEQILPVVTKTEFEEFRTDEGEFSDGLDASVLEALTGDYEAETDEDGNPVSNVIKAAPSEEPAVDIEALVAERMAAAEQEIAAMKEVAMNEIDSLKARAIEEGQNMGYEEGLRRAAEENEAAMNEEMQRVKSGQITYAVRDTVIDDKTIKEGNIMGLGDDGLLAVGEDIAETTMATIAALVDEDSEIISIYYGEDVSEEEAEELTEKLEEAYPDCEVELNQGGQPIYYYVVSVE